MDDTSYRTIPREDGTFAVEIVRPGMLPQMAAGFASEADAAAWIVQDRRLREAADPFGSPRSRRR